MVEIGIMGQTIVVVDHTTLFAALRGTIMETIILAHGRLSLLIRGVILTEKAFACEILCSSDFMSEM